MNANELLMNVAKETEAANGIIGDLCRVAAEFQEQGLPVERVRSTVGLARVHLSNALAAATALEELAKGCPAPQKG